MFKTQDLLAAAQHLHRAIRAAVDPEAFSDFHGEHPFIELRDPAAIVRPWRPGAGIVARQAAAMVWEAVSSAQPELKPYLVPLRNYLGALTAKAGRTPARDFALGVLTERVRQEAASI